MGIPKLTYILLLVVFLSYASFLSLGSIKGFPTQFKEKVHMPYLSDRPIGEDGFYMLTVGWNVPIYKKICYNNGILTAGVQPLSTFVFAIAAFLTQSFGGDKWHFLRVIIIFESLLLLLFSFLIYKLSVIISSQAINKQILLVISTAFTIFNFTMFKLFTYGLETGVYLNLFALTVLVSIKILQKNSFKFRRLIFLSVLMGLTMLARVDFGITAVGILIILFLKKLITFKRAVLSAFIIFIIVAPWFFYVKFVTDSWIPSSGTAQAGFVISLDDFSTRFIVAMTAVFDHSVPFIYTANRIYLGVLCLIVLASVLALYFKYRGSEKLFEIGSSKILSYWLYSIIPLVFIYLFYFTAVHFYFRYFAPLSVIFIPFMTILFTGLFSRFKIKALQFSPAVLAIVSFLVYTAVFFHMGNTGWSRSISAGYIYNSNMHPRKLGTFQSGVVGYFNDNVVNLDGKIDHNALRYLKQNKIHVYIDSMKIDYLNDWQQYINFIDEKYLRENWEIIPGTPQDSSLYFERKSFKKQTTNRLSP